MYSSVVRMLVWPNRSRTPCRLRSGLRISSVPRVCRKRWGLTVVFSRFYIYLKQFATCQIVMILRVW